MYAQTRQMYIKSTRAARDARKLNVAQHQQRVLDDLKRLGVSRVGLASAEAKYLPHVIHPHEQIGGVAYGMHPDGFAMLVATDSRVIFLDKKPLFTNEEEINYAIVGGVSYSHVGWGTMIVLHTRIRDYPIRTFNKRCAESFVEFIEQRSLEHQKNREETAYDQPGGITKPATLEP